MLGFLKLLKIFLFLLEMDSSHDYKYCNNLNVTAYIGKLSCDFKKITFLIFSGYDNGNSYFLFY